jgi:hypothetical protein
MKRRTFLTTIVVLCSTWQTSIAAARQANRCELALETILLPRRLMRQINRAFPHLRSDHHIRLVKTQVTRNVDLASSLYSAFGLSNRALRSVTRKGLQDAYRKRKNDDLRSLQIVEIDGHLLAVAEVSLGKILQAHDLL